MPDPADTIREGLDPTGYTKKALAALTELEQQLAAAQDLAAAMQDSANRGWEHHAAAERDRDRLADTLREIQKNAEAWHGPELDNGHARALKVIAEWCDAALTTPEEKP